MTDAATTAEVIRAFVDLAIAQRRISLSREDRAKIADLEEQLRDQIDGARPAPRRIGGHTEVVKGARPQAPTVVVADEATKPLVQQSSIATIAKKLELSLADKKKLNEISREELPASSYTRPIAPAYLSDYYSDDLSPSEDIDPRSHPTSVLGADGSTVELSREVRVLFGLEWDTEEPKPGPKARATAASARALPAEGGAPKGRPTIVHLLAGGTYRGQIEPFDPTSGIVRFVKEESGGPNEVALTDVLAIFFGVQRGEEAPPPAGQRVVVKLVNDRQVTGLTDDYQEGGEYLTIMPEQRRGNVDRIWIPAWAVKEIQLG